MAWVSPLTIAGFAQDGRDPCAGSPTEAALHACRKAQFDNSENQMVLLYDKLHRSYLADEPKRAEYLAQSQSSWVTYRDAVCRVETFESASGRAAAVYFLDCLKTVNEERISRLKALLSAP
jgi:uncharacterized protein YecT (DUF1311 family)